MADLFDAVDLAVDTDPLKLRDALVGVLGEHPRSVLVAGVVDRLREVHGVGRCAHCSIRRVVPEPTLIREFKGRVNGEACVVHEHVDPEPYCMTCHSTTDYEGHSPWPCATVRAVTSALGIQEGDTDG